jgi:anaerobic selenocysteine-containing dehydrogenase
VASDYIFPDRHGLESWGYQRVATGTAQSVLSGLQPVVSGVYARETPTLVYDARGTTDVLIAAAKLAGDPFAQALPFADEVEFIRSKLTNLIGQPDGSFVATEISSFSAYFQQHGGWWKNTADLIAPAATNALGKDLNVNASDVVLGEDEYYFVPFVSPTLGEAGANKPWLQELADPMTTVMWNTWLEINPKTAEEHGIEDDDVVRIVSEANPEGIEVAVYKYPGIRPDTIAMPFGQGHTAYGIYAQGRGVNPADLFAAHFNEAGDLAFAGLKVKVEKTGKKRELSRMEGKLGVYGFTEEK